MPTIGSMRRSFFVPYERNPGIMEMPTAEV